MIIIKLISCMVLNSKSLLHFSIFKFQDLGVVAVLVL